MKKEKGITLIALVITIIVMMILVAVTVSIAVNGGLFSYAGRAAKRTDQEKVREEIQSIIPMYYLEQNKPDGQTFQEFLAANLEENGITGFSQKFETPYNESGMPIVNETAVTGYTFFYKGYGFFVEKDSLRIILLEDMDEITSADSMGIYELITNINDLEVGQKYIIVGKETENTTDAYFVMDEYDEGINEDEEQYARRKNQLYPANGDTILYTGNYAITIEKDGNNYYLYDSHNKEYLSAPDEKKLGLGDKDEFSKTTINITNGIAQIKFIESNTYMKNNNYITSCYQAGQNDICLYKYIGTEIKDKLETPTDVIATPDDGKVTLQWSEVEGAYSYTVTQQDEEGNQTKQIVTENTVVFEELRNGYIYGYQIRANSAGGAKANSLWTDARQVVPGSGEYELVTSEADLIAGTRYIIATSGTSGNAYTVGAQNGNYREKVAVTITNDKTIIENENYYPLRLEGTTNSWKWKDLKTDKTQYLYGGNKAWGYNSQGRTDECSVSVDSTTNIASIMYGSYYIKYNSGSPRFTGYSSGQTDLYLYKEIGESVLTAPVVEAQGINGQATLQWGMARGATYYLVWNGVESNEPVTSPYTKTGLQNGTEYQYQIKAVKDEEEKYSAEGTVTPIATKTYQLITNTSDITSGSAYLIVNSKTVGNALAINDASNSSKMGGQSVTILQTNPVTIQYAGEAEYKYLLEKDNAENAWRIHETVSDRYLYTPYNSNSLYIGSVEIISTADTDDGLTDIDLFNISFGSSGNVLFGGYCSVLQERTIKFNTSNNVFSFYGSNSQGVKEVYLFKCID